MLARPTIRQIEMFLGLAEAGSFGHAAERLGISQSGLSQSITQMEYLLGIRLFDRTTRQVKLTHAGTQFKLRAERVMSEYELAVDDLGRLADPKQGRVTLACISSIAVSVIPQAIAVFRASSPNVTVSIKDDNSFGVVNRLKAGDVDFAVGVVMESDPEIEFTPLLQDRFGIVCRADHPLAGRETATWADLQGESYVAFAPETGTAMQLRQALQGHVNLPRARYEAFHLSTIVGMVERGIGIAVLPYLAAPVETGNLCYRRLGNPVVERTLGIMAPRGRSLSVEAQEFRNCVIAQVRGLARTPPDVALCLPEERPSRVRQRRSKAISALGGTGAHRV